MRIIHAHPDPPTMRSGIADWDASFAAMSDAGLAQGPPTLIVADLNAARWHPSWRRLVRRGWRDAHEIAGRG
ncbi:MAG TPA: hypothetical protein PLV68_18455, partial [Ilumatobacteraceae bacterium]|nr:hypothetical protein [Ilumatobacteraceae bacterium]